MGWASAILLNCGTLAVKKEGTAKPGSGNSIARSSASLFRWQQL